MSDPEISYKPMERRYVSLGQRANWTDCWTMAVWVTWQNGALARQACVLPVSKEPAEATARTMLRASLATWAQRKLDDRDWVARVTTRVDARNIGA